MTVNVQFWRCIMIPKVFYILINLIEKNALSLELKIYPSYYILLLKLV